MAQAAAPRPMVVLVVEDQPLLRMMAADMVADAGFDVVEACDSTEAIAILEKRADIRIVFTDVDMPRGMDGVRLAATIRDRWPPIEIIITTGKIAISAEMMPPRSVFFSKPYRPQEVVALMHSMVA